jgi:hypothetical protein
MRGRSLSLGKKQKQMDVVSFKFDQERQVIEVVFRDPSGIVLLRNPPIPAPDRVWRETYGIVDGRLAIVKRDEGTHTPGRYMDERISFDPA